MVRHQREPRIITSLEGEGEEAGAAFPKGVCHRLSEARRGDGRRPSRSTAGGQEEHAVTTDWEVGGSSAPSPLPSHLPCPDWKWLAHVNPSSLMGGFIYAFQIHC